MNEKTILSIKENGSYEMTIKKSRFICSLARVDSEQEAEDFIDRIRQQERKATHNCFAYMIGDDDHIQRESDNGEPSGTAGVPILKALQMAGVHGVCAVVTRYFGGIKLGAGGLIRAYSNVTTEAIEQVGLVQKVLQTVLAIEVDYAQHDQLMYFLNQQQLQVADENYGVKVTVKIFVNDDQVDETEQQLTNLFAGQVTCRNVGQRINEIPYQA